MSSNRNKKVDRYRRIVNQFTGQEIDRMIKSALEVHTVHELPVKRNSAMFPVSFLGLARFWTTYLFQTMRARGLKSFSEWLGNPQEMQRKKVALLRAILFLGEARIWAAQVDHKRKPSTFKPSPRTFNLDQSMMALSAASRVPRPIKRMVESIGAVERDQRLMLPKIMEPDRENATSPAWICLSSSWSVLTPENVARLIDRGIAVRDYDAYHVNWFAEAFGVVFEYVTTVDQSIDYSGKKSREEIEVDDPPLDVVEASRTHPPRMKLREIDGPTVICTDKLDEDLLVWKEFCELMNERQAWCERVSLTSPGNDSQFVVRASFDELGPMKSARFFTQMRVSASHFVLGSVYQTASTGGMSTLESGPVYGSGSDHPLQEVEIPLASSAKSVIDLDRQLAMI